MGSRSACALLATERSARRSAGLGSVKLSVVLGPIVSAARRDALVTTSTAVGGVAYKSTHVHVGGVSFDEGSVHRLLAIAR
jgi:hypothetical protein